MRYDTKDLLKLPGEGETTETDMLIKARSRDMGGDFSVMEGVVHPGDLLAPHTHKFEDQLVFVITGELEFEVGGEGGLRFTAPAGSYVQKPRGFMHCFWNKGETTSRYIELSGKAGFEGYVDSHGEGTVKSTLNSDRDWGMKMNVEEIPRLMKEHGLTGLSAVSMPEIPSLPKSLKDLFKKVKS